MIKSIIKLIYSVSIVFLTISCVTGCSRNRITLGHKPHNNQELKSSYTNVYTQQYDGAAPEHEIPDLSLIQNPVPKYEAKSRYGNPCKYKVFNRTYKVLPSSIGYVESGEASWYGTKFHGFRTSSGEIYDMYKMTAAHKTLPLPTYAKVINLANNRSIIVKINDRGPFHGNRILDLSYVAASKLGILSHGVARVKVIALPLQPANFNIQDQPKELNLPTDNSCSNDISGSDNRLAVTEEIQIGAFKIYANAVRLVNNLENVLQKSNFNPYKINILQDSSGAGEKAHLYRVIVKADQGKLDTKYLNEILLHLN